MINPTEEQFRIFADHPDTGAVQMINLLQFKEHATYPSGHELAGPAGGSGAEAYQRYADVALKKVGDRGGRIVLLSTFDQMFIGEKEEWHQIAIIEYPSRAAFLDMVQDPEYLAATVHRDAGLERTSLIATTPVVDASRT